ncbi:MAG: aminotransferase class III-fold pyridoxal phosphate-dependent enzyme [Planctomycetes bacterium]|nr:aminotransferase class III-fold pyridoxal phosphate-dependent enzyme [Planctomycetota bacterium]
MIELDRVLRVGFHEGFDQVDSAGIPSEVTDKIVNTGFNDPEKLSDHFKKYGDKLACFLMEPIIGAGGLMPASLEYLQLARELTEKYGVLLILDEVVSAFHFRAGDAGALYGVKADLLCLGKAIGGGMPVAAVAGRADILDLVSKDGDGKVKFSGGTHSGHPASMIAAKVLMEYLVENEEKIYPAMARQAVKAREVIRQVFAEEGILVRFAGDRLDVLEGNSLHMMLFPYAADAELVKPEEVRNPAVCDIELSEKVTKLAFLLEGVFTVHGLGCTTYAHGDQEIRFLGEACTKVARRIKPYL